MTARTDDTPKLQHQLMLAQITGSDAGAAVLPYNHLAAKLLRAAYWGRRASLGLYAIQLASWPNCDPAGRESLPGGLLLLRLCVTWRSLFRLQMWCLSTRCMA